MQNRIDNSKIISLPSILDERGVLTVMESNREIPFEIKRIFYMHHIKKDRGGHAHMDTDQVVIAISGSFDIELFDGENRGSYHMDDPTKGLYIPRMIFMSLSDFSDHGVCMVIANNYYDITRSFRTMEDFINLRA